MAIAAFITAFFAPVLGVILGVAALRRIKRRGEDGRGLAIAALWIAPIMVMLGGLVVNAVRPDPNASVAGNRGVSINLVRDGASVKVGDCFNADDNDGKQLGPEIKVAPCSANHRYEVFARTTIESGYPGPDDVRTIAFTYCNEEAHSYVLDFYTLPANVGRYYTWPTYKSWTSGDTLIMCTFRSPTDLTGSLRMDATRFKDDQVRFLKAVNPVDDQWPLMTDDNNAPPPVGDMKRLAGAMMVCLDRELAALTAAPWPTSAVGKLIATQRVWQSLWAKVGPATSDAGITEAYTTALDYANYDEYIAARETLGLPTEQGGTVRT